MNKKQLSALSVIFGLLAAMVSCQNSNTPDNTIVTATNDLNAEQTSELSDESGEISRLNAEMSLPKLDFDNEVINILYVGEDVYRTDIYAENTGDLLDDAVYRRNISIEELLNIKLNPICYSDKSKDTADHMIQTIISGEDLYDLCSTPQSYTVQRVTENYYYNMIDDKYIDWEKPWWNLDYMKEMVVGDDKIFFLQGDISIMRMKSLGCIFFNKQMYTDLYGNPDELYNTVLDGKWTFDKFNDLVRGAYADLNGNSEVDIDDRLGAFMSVYKGVEQFQFAAGVTATTRNSEGIPEFTMNNEKTIEFTNMLYNLYYENVGSTVLKNDSFTDSINKFISGGYLFAPLWFRHMHLLRDMTIDYGMVNYPKYDENDEYKTLVHTGTTVFCVPVTSKKTDIVGAVCEALAFYNYKSVTPTYYEVAMKIKYSRDDVTSQILDIISDSAYTNFGYIYAKALNEISYLRDLMANRSNNFSSWYAGKIKSAETGLANLIKIYTE